jgi:hypothetical protein
MSIEEAVSRINNQIPYEEQKKYADIVLKTTHMRRFEKIIYRKIMRK